MRRHVALLRCAAEVLAAHAAVADDGSGTLIALQQETDQDLQIAGQELQQKEDLVAELFGIADLPRRAAQAWLEAFQEDEQ